MRGWYDDVGVAGGGFAGKHAAARLALAGARPKVYDARPTDSVAARWIHEYVPSLPAGCLSAASSRSGSWDPRQ